LSGFGPIVSFWGLSALAVIAALMVMAARTLVHAVLFLVLFFVALAAMFILLSRDFFAAAPLLSFARAISGEPLGSAIRDSVRAPACSNGRCNRARSRSRCRPARDRRKR